MRPAVSFGILALGAFALLALIFLSPKATIVPEVEPSGAAATEPLAGSKPETPTRNGLARLTESPSAQSSGNLKEKEKGSQAAELEAEARAEQREADVTARISELRDLSRKTDPGSLETLLSEMKNPDPEIRLATLDIISESGNRAAIPGLLEAAAQTEDATEKQAIADAIAFLNLPTLTEVLAQTDRGSDNPGSAGPTKPGGPKPPSTNSH